MGRENKQILVYEAALKLFAKYGFKKTTLDDIGNELGMTKGNLYLYAKNKRDLYESSIAHALKQWQKDAHESSDKETDPINRIFMYCYQGYCYLKHNPDLKTLIINDPGIFPISPKEDRFHTINNESMGFLKEMLKQGIDDGVFRTVELESVSEFLYSVYVMLIIRTYVKSEDRLGLSDFKNGFDLILNGLKSRK